MKDAMAAIIAGALLLLGACDVSAAQPQLSPRATLPDVSTWTWGPYRPNLYFGIRPMVPETFLMGLMWANGDSQSSMLDTLRDTCEQDDGMEGYGWTMYDTRMGGSQTIHDSTLHLDLTTEFFKTSDGLSWSARVKGVPRPDAPRNLKTTLIFHVALEGAQVATDQRFARCDNDKNGKFTGFRCAAMVPEFGPVDIYQLDHPSNKIVHGPAVKSLTVPEDKIWQAKAVYKDAIKSAGKREMVVNEPGVGNMHFSQLVLKGPFSVTFAFRSDAGAMLDAPTLSHLSKEFDKSFSTRVDEVFTRAAPYQGSKYAEFARSLISNLLGGLGFFHGDEKVDYSHAPEYNEEGLKFWENAATAMKEAPITTTKKKSLVSHTPSRPFFPRGFLWDEGFHLLPIIEWDLGLAVSMLKKWLNLMDDDGWIAREQILGPEARSKVPTKFQTQYPHYANPLSLFLVVENVLSKVTKRSPYRGYPSKYINSSQEAQSVLKELFPLLDRHYNWFRRTQAGNLTGYARPAGASPEVYRWRGRTPGHTLTSGLDDYPRSEPPHPGELHVDALSWVGVAARALQQTAEYLGEDSTVYKDQLDGVLNNLDVLHWSNDQSAYCDSTIRGKGRHQHICHLGYLSLMPLLLGHMDEYHPYLPAVLDLLHDPEKLWSHHGLRSLSAADLAYGTDEDYWRGAVWMHLNVLAVQRLHALSDATPAGVRAQTLAGSLRRRVLDTVYSSWKDTGFVWEQYNDATGAGQHSRAFTGWTSSVILLLGLEDVVPPLDMDVEPGEPFDPDAGAVAPSGNWGLWAAVFFLMAAALVAFRRKGSSTFRGVVARCRAWLGGYRHVGQEIEGERLVVDLDDLHEADDPIR